MILKKPRLHRPKNRMDRIAFAGPMCVGKTALAKSLEEKGYKKLAFADKLKAISYDLYGLQGKNNFTRKLLQELADDLKKWDKELFIKHLLLQVEHQINNGFEKLVVDDLRFPAEAKALKENGFIIVGVTCDENIRLNRIKRLYPDTESSRMEHPSEKGWQQMKFDYEIVSNDPLAFYEVLTMVENGNSYSFHRKK